MAAVSGTEYTFADAFNVTGIGVGAVVSLLFLKRRSWPVAFGAGFGVGMAYSNCQHDFRSPYLLHGHMEKHLQPLREQKGRDRQTDRQTDRQSRGVGRETDRQTE
ncbi:hypothetical protein P4O66_006578 [Electrophorus voltai]|uniref:MICOS complex subunit MIC10 n=1 Tax=Electrophorus voltai TaxID=2609070 RepID=A0AAD8ZJ24_9TELE|nr:hypothetical protein P4O66_006578 [Electrophorus voltai]